MKTYFKTVCLLCFAIFCYAFCIFPLNGLHGLPVLWKTTGQILREFKETRNHEYGEIPKQPKPHKNKQNQGKIKKHNKKLTKQKGPYKNVKPFYK